jgi:hypothetical protein
MILHPGEDEFVLIRAPSSSFLLVGRAHERFALVVDTVDEEYCEPVRPGDLVCVSAPEGGAVRAAAMLLLLVRDYHYPVVALPKGHPGVKRIPMVISAAPEITLSCGIVRGTHPDQHLLCSSVDLAGLILRGEGETVMLEALPQGCTISYICVNSALADE